MNQETVTLMILLEFMKQYIQEYMRKYDLIYAPGASVDFNMERLIKAAEDYCSDDKIENAWEEGYQKGKEEWYDKGWNAAREEYT